LLALRRGSGKEEPPKVFLQEENQQGCWCWVELSWAWRGFLTSE
jgi:hypothetical protein